MLNFCDFIQVYVFTTNHHINHTCTVPILVGLFVNLDTLDCSVRHLGLPGCWFSFIYVVSFNVQPK